MSEYQLLFHHRSRPAQDSTLQRGTKSPCSLNRPTVAAGVALHACTLLFDRDAKFGDDVVTSAQEMGSEPVRTAFRSPWQNGVAERWVGSCRRDLLDHVIVLNERHLKRLSEYVRYYHEDRTHLGLAKDTPAGRATTIRSAVESKIRSFPRLGGLHHRYAVAV
jgi:transposase InsO family protein